MNDTIDQKSEYFQSMMKLAEYPYHYKPYSARNWGHIRHTLCSYPSKIKPSIAHYLVILFSKPHEIVLDPFSGVGTIPFEACLNTRKGIGIDLSPFAFNVTNSKVHKINKLKVNDIIEEIRKEIEILREIEIPECEAKPFYHPDTFKEILIAKKYFQNNNISPEKSFVFSCLLHILHGNRPYALSRRSHNIIPIPPKGDFIYKSLIKSLSEKTDRLLEKALPDGFTEGSAFLGDACDMEIESKSIDKIITSPPFLGTTEFLRQNRIRLWFCGWDADKITALKRSSHFLEYNELKLYPKIFAEFNRVLKKDGLIVLHSGVYKNKNMAMSLIPIAKKNDFKILGLINEDSSHLENHGRTDRGGTHTHQFLILKKEN